MSHKITQAEILVAIAEIDELRAELAELDAEHAALFERLERLSDRRNRARAVLDAAESTTDILDGTPVRFDEETGYVTMQVFDGTHRHAQVYRNVRTHRWNVRVEGRRSSGRVLPAEFDTAQEAVDATAAWFRS
jgi:hypothetical protein